MTKKVKILLSFLLVISIFMVSGFNQVHADPNDVHNTDVSDPYNTP